MRQLVDYPHIRECPPHVLAGLRAIEPTAELLYFGRGRWLLWCYKPNPWAMAEGAKILERALELDAFCHNNPRFTFNPAHTRRMAGRIEYGLLGARGWKFIKEYLLRGSPTWAIVDDFLMEHVMNERTTAAELDRLADAAHDQAVAEARADLTDPARGRDVCHWMNTINVTPGIPLDHKAHAPRSSAKTLVATLPPP